MEHMHPHVHKDPDELRSKQPSVPKAQAAHLKRYFGIYQTVIISEEYYGEAAAATEAKQQAH